MKEHTVSTAISKMFFLVLLLGGLLQISAQQREKQNFCADWKFLLGEVQFGENPGTDDSKWRTLDLPHDWSIEGAFSKDNPAGTGGGALPGGFGWYRKHFVLPESYKDKRLYIEFDGVYRNSEVWINGTLLGKRPNGYISFRYDITPYVKFDSKDNVIAVRVDNSKQPNSRWYSGSGIYRNVWLLATNDIAVTHWGHLITTPVVSEKMAEVQITTTIENHTAEVKQLLIETSVFDAQRNVVGRSVTTASAVANGVKEVTQSITVSNPDLWSVDHPALYTAETRIVGKNSVFDNYSTRFGIRFFSFDAAKGFLLNGKKVKIQGACNHHDLGCLGAALNTTALRRQLSLMKEMGLNALRTSHNPPAPEVLDLCDEMGLIVMDEAFDIWSKKKSEYDYALDWSEWHVKDLQDMILRDRNHPSVFIWSIGNEIIEQYDTKDSTGAVIARELAGIVKKLDNSRPITAACNSADSLNPLIRSGALDIIGYNYNLDKYAAIPVTYPGKPFIGTETVSSLTSRGSYDMPSDSVRIWPVRWDLPLETGNADLSCSAYDNCQTPWGSTHTAALKIINKLDHVAGQFIWTAWDYLGEPTPYPWPARSSYFGVIDLAGFPKDPFYLYQSVLTNKPVLHVFPHWNWKMGELRDIWVYTNCTEVELYLNGTSLGLKKRGADDLHLQWRTNFTPGELKAVGKTADGKTIEQVVKTAGEPYAIVLEAEKSDMKANGTDLFFVQAKVVDENGVLVPLANNRITFSVSGDARIVAADNGLQTDMESFQSPNRCAYNGKCLVVIKSGKTPGVITVTAKAESLKTATARLTMLK